MVFSSNQRIPSVWGLGEGLKGKRQKLKTQQREKERDGGRFCKSRRGKEKIQGWMLATPGQGTDGRGGHRETSPDAPGEPEVQRIPSDHIRGSGDTACATQHVRLQKQTRQGAKHTRPYHLSGAVLCICLPPSAPSNLPCSRAISEKVCPRHAHRSCRQGSSPGPTKGQSM